MKFNRAPIHAAFIVLVLVDTWNKRNKMDQNRLNQLSQYHKVYVWLGRTIRIIIFYPSHFKYYKAQRPKERTEESTAQGYEELLLLNTLIHLLCNRTVNS